MLTVIWSFSIQLLCSMLFLLAGGVLAGVEHASSGGGSAAVAVLCWLLQVPCSALLLLAWRVLCRRSLAAHLGWTLVGFRVNLQVFLL